MALIHCPECGKEISDQALSCPYCGLPMTPASMKNNVDLSQEQPDQPPEPKRRKLIWGLAVIGIVAVVAVIIGIVISNNKSATREAYIHTINTARYAMLKGAAESETTCNLISAVWHNTIFEKSDTSTDKYTKQSGKFYDDFNDALVALFSSSEYKDHVVTIKAAQTVAADYMQELQEPPDGLETAYNTLCDMYEEFTGFTNLAISPTGSLQTFNQSFSASEDAFMRYYEKLGTQIPEK